MNQVLDQINRMKHSPIRNYVIPGLTSWMISVPNSDGSCIRFLESSRIQTETITPHSHRFGLSNLVLAGEVHNTLWTVTTDHQTRHAEPYMATEQTYGGKPGLYGCASKKEVMARSVTSVYKVGQSYAMRANEIHSIHFSKGAAVLLIEGAKENETSVILEPLVDGLVIQTRRVEPWMFLKGEV